MWRVGTASAGLQKTPNRRFEQTTDPFDEVALAGDFERFAFSSLERLAFNRRSAMRSIRTLRNTRGIAFFQLPERHQLDKALCVTLSPLAGPLALIAAGVVYADDGLPVVLRQERVGRNGKAFEMFKFRSMVRNAKEKSMSLGNRAYGIVTITDEAGEHPDPRLLPSARFTRGFADELPQLMHVWRGQMALVGPRATEVGERNLWRQRWPGKPELFEDWAGDNGWRYSVDPGICDPCGIRRRRGQHFSADTLPERMEIEREFLHSGSLDSYLSTMVLALAVAIRHGNSREAMPILPCEDLTEGIPPII